MSSAVITALRLTDFRAYAEARLEGLTGVTFLFGPNGAGKTNLLEAISWLAPGRGLRGATAVEAGRREAGETQSRAWAVSADLAPPRDDPDGPGARVGTGLESAGGRRVVRIDGQPAAPGRLADLVRLVWLTPAQDRLFVEGATERRRFLDRLVFADRPSHAREVSDYERASRERLRLLTGDAPADAAWLDALEAKIGEAGAAITLARLATVAALTEEIERRTDRPFPLARLTLADATADAEPEAMADAIRRASRNSRARDAAAGRALSGPHRADLKVVHVEKDRPAAECSTGEQKALLLNIVMAQAARLARDQAAPRPVLLLDEVAAHLDPDRRAALYDELTALGLQAFLTGVEDRLFAGLTGGVGVEVLDGRLKPV